MRAISVHRGWPIYYGWLVLAASAVSEMLAVGTTGYASGLFVLPLQHEFHISRTAASSTVLILFLGSAVFAPMVGRLLDRYPARIVIALGAVLFALSMAAIALSHTLWIMALILLLPAAASLVAIGPMNTATMASRWFFRRRGLALGIAAIATSGGGFTVVPLLSMAIQQYGWRIALLAEAAALAVIIVALALLVVRDSPAAAGLADHPENAGSARAETRLALADTGSLGWRAILSSRAFWLAAGTLALVSGTSQALLVALVPFAAQLGFSAGAAALLIAAFSICAGVTKIVAGLLADRVDLRWLLAAGGLLMALAWLGLSISPGYELLLTAACLGGVALGFALPSTAALIAAMFGAARFATVMGWAYTLLLSCAVASVLFAGIVYDRSGSYRLAFLIFAGLLALQFMAILLLPLPRHGRGA
jgi:sugar phosphate permease